MCIFVADCCGDHITHMCMPWVFVQLNASEDGCRVQLKTFCFVVFYLCVYGGVVIDEYVFRTGP